VQSVTKFCQFWIRFCSFCWNSVVRNNYK